MALRSLVTWSCLCVAVVMASPHHISKSQSTSFAAQTVTVTVTAPGGSGCSASLPPSGTTTTSSSSSSSVSVSVSSSASSNTSPTTTLIATATATNYGLNDAATQKADKLWFGTAADIPGTGGLTDVFYMEEFNNSRDFGGATPANMMKFVYTEPEPNTFNFSGGDTFVALATAAHKRYIRCHNLIWYNELPDWVAAPATNWTAASLSAVLVNHVTQLVSHFGDACYSWDVVNEALSDAPADPAASNFSSNIWYDTIGPEYFYLAYAAASKAVRENGLKVKLYYNDYNIESPGKKSSAAQVLVRELQDRGIQIDGVGMESHFVVGETPSLAEQEENMRAYTQELGVEVAVTELDVRMLSLPANESSQAQQVEDYYNTVKACVNVEGCVGITVWDFDDTYSWIPSTFTGQGYADIVFQPDGPDTPLVKKAVYDGILEALTG